VCIKERYAINTSILTPFAIPPRNSNAFEPCLCPDVDDDVESDEDADALGAPTPSPMTAAVSAAPNRPVDATYDDDETNGRPTTAWMQLQPMFRMKMLPGMPFATPVGDEDALYWRTDMNATDTSNISHWWEHA
jgi:hypothetical protein